MKRFNNNIFKYYLFSSLSSAVFFYAIDKIFMELRGLAVSEIVWVEIVYMVVVLLLEVPSGAIADRWSRKYVLIFNMLFFIANTAVWIFAGDVFVFILGAVCGSMQTVLISGTGNAFLYDSLKQYSLEKQYEKILGKVRFYSAITGALAGIVGGIISQYLGLIYTFWFTLPILLIGLIVALTFKEPKFHRTTGEINYWQHIKSTGKYLWKHKLLWNIITIMVVLGVVMGLVDEYVQLYFFDIGLALVWMGFISAFAGITEAFAGRWSYKLKKYKQKYVYLILIIVSMFGFLFIGLLNSFWGILFAFLPGLTFYVIEPLLLGKLHKELSSSQRATGESFVSLLRSLIYIPMALFFGFTSDKLSIGKAYLFVGVFLFIFVVYYIISIIYYRKD